MIVGRETNGVISWGVNFRFRVLLERRTNQLPPTAVMQLIKPLLIYLICTQRACGARVASVRLTYAREKRIYCNRQSLFGLLEYGKPIVAKFKHDFLTIQSVF